MNAGLPGTGIGGLFYLLSALCMPFAEVARMVRGRKQQSAWKLVIAQVSLATTMLAALTVIGLLTDYLISFSSRLIESIAPGFASTKQAISLGVAPALITFGVLFTFLLSIEIAALFFSRRRVKKPDLREGAGLEVLPPFEGVRDAG